MAPPYRSHLLPEPRRDRGAPGGADHGQRVDMHPRTRRDAPGGRIRRLPNLGLPRVGKRPQEPENGPETAVPEAADSISRCGVPPETGLPVFAGKIGKLVTQYACPPGRHTTVPRFQQASGTGEEGKKGLRQSRNGFTETGPALRGEERIHDGPEQRAPAPLDRERLGERERERTHRPVAGRPELRDRQGREGPGRGPFQVHP